ncbi:fused MFS/spermidine synthase [Paraglaciecola aquimarina]|uniref:Fused MFS/spermidine synthase n=1 Tax=Paraglaciecola aquimarina TaxID=1235557 RepID=A0ABU3T007_9ALTE|nr:fused MFS/spermidine synthase [Paraglaciecola aquimarina]MDU0355593.1 fused MFS/spermidine synthase [Paraglaciecola aquimarina]
MTSLPIEFVSLHVLVDGKLPTLEIVKILSMGIGFPFLLLASTSPLLQSWFSSEGNARNPYLLYAMSNVGSFLALLSYPIIVEPVLHLSTQTLIWSISYGIFVVCLVVVCFMLFKATSLKESLLKEKGDNQATSSFVILMWFCLSALGVVILVSSTNAMTQNIPPMPFLWIAPLAVYLATYVLAFSDWKLYQRKIWLVLYVLAIFLGLFIYFIGGQFDIFTQIFIYLFVLLAATMICHGELSYLKPENKNPTLFYLILSLGGVFGSFLVSVVAQVSFTDFVEYPIALCFVFVMLGLSAIYKSDLVSKGRVSSSSTRTVSHYWLSISCFFAFLIFACTFIYMNTLYQQYDVIKQRNFYGVLSVKEVIDGNVRERRLVDGTTAHGGQSLVAATANTPLSYYRPSTGVERVLTELSKGQKLNVAIVGLGVGALAAYANDGDAYTFYELNPAVVKFADHYFSFIKDSKATVNITLGDARVNLQAEADSGQLNNFDVIVVDAFSGDQIPSHLLTQQAFLLYEKHLKNDGAIMLHISNRHLTLLPVVMAGADLLTKQVMFFSTSGGEIEHDAEWVLLSNNSELLNAHTLRNVGSRLRIENSKTIQWTDDYSSLFSILKVLN